MPKAVYHYCHSCRNTWESHEEKREFTQTSEIMVWCAYCNHVGAQANVHEAEELAKAHLSERPAHETCYLFPLTKIEITQ
jgi:uncharacterized Zn finger protein